MVKESERRGEVQRIRIQDELRVSASVRGRRVERKRKRIGSVIFSLNRAHVRKRRKEKEEAAGRCVSRGRGSGSRTGPS